MQPETVTTAVSNLDVTPTLCELAGVSMDEVMPWVEGESLVHLGNGGVRTSAVAMEYAAEASYSPLVSLRLENYKYNRCLLDNEQLFDLEADPHELQNLASDSRHKQQLEYMQKLSQSRWDLDAFDAQVRESQARRWVVYEALRNGDYFPWDYQPLQRASERYMRNHMNLDNLEESKRFPRGE